MTQTFDWKRTGPITLRCEPYVVIKFSRDYLALYGRPAERESLGEFATADEAKAACEAHATATATSEKNPRSDFHDLPG